MFLCQQVPWIPKELYITGYNWVTNLTGFITIWIVRHTLQFFPNLPHMNHRISIDLANIPPTHSPEKCHKISHHGMPPTHSWDPGFLQIHWPRPRGCRWTSSLGIIFISWLMASWHWRSKHRHFWRSEWDRNGFYQKKYDVVRKFVGDLMRFYHLKLALSQNDSKNDAPGLVLKGEPTGKARYGGEDML